MKVFDDKERTYTGWALGNEGTYAWLDRSALPESATARERIEQLYAGFPDSSRRLLRNLRHPDGKHAGAAFYGAVASMLMNERLVELGFAVATDEDAHGSEARPDLVASRADIGDLVVEVTVLRTKQEFADREWRTSVLCDAINEGVESDYFMLAVRINGELPECFDPQPVVRAIRDGLRRRAVPSAGEIGELGGEADIVCRIRNATVEVRFIATTQGHDDDNGRRIIGFYPGSGGLPNTEGRLRSKLRGKRPANYPSHVVSGVTPYVIAIGLFDVFASARSCHAALWGDEALILSRDALDDGRLVRKHNGFFGIGPNGPRHKDVSGVLLMHRFASEIWKLGQIELVYFENPYAECPIDVRLLAPHRVFGVVEQTDDTLRLDWLDCQA